MANNIDEKDKIQKAKLTKDSGAPSEVVQNNRSRGSSTLAWVLGIIAVFVVLGMFATMFGVAAFNRNHFGNRADEGIMSMGSFGGRRHFVGWGTISTNQVAISGVVTAVNGQNFTVAGNGTTNNVQTNSNTQYSGAD
jgi:hypothetical protein